MERKIGDIFDFNGIKLQVKEAERRYSCNGCYFKKPLTSRFDYTSIINCMYRCCEVCSSDGKGVIFVEVKQ